MIVQRLTRAILLSATCGIGSLGSASAAGCPTQPQVQNSIQSYIYAVDWTPNLQTIYAVKFVGNFKFGAMRLGKIYGSICPVRIEYTYEVLKNDGTTTITKGGENKTHLFYQDSFGDWRFRVETNN
jgi:hypothetical protein